MARPRTAPAHARAATALRAAAAGLACAMCVAAGVGWLYLLRRQALLDAGPGVGGALPLERLAHHEAQPLLRMVAAWVPAGVLAGWALAAAGAGERGRCAVVAAVAERGRCAVVAAAVAERGWCAVVAATVAFVVLAATGAASDAVTANERFSSHVGSQFGHAGPWVAAALVAVGAFIAPHRPPAGPRDATRRSGAGRAAA